MIYYYIPFNATSLQTKNHKKTTETKSSQPPKNHMNQLSNSITPMSHARPQNHIEISKSAAALDLKANFRTCVNAVKQNLTPVIGTGVTKDHLRGETMNDKLLKNVFRIVCPFQGMTAEYNELTSTAFLVKVGKETKPEYFVVTNCHAVINGAKNAENEIILNLKQDTEQNDFMGRVVMMNKYVDLALIEPSADLIVNFGQYACSIDLDSLEPGTISFVPLKTKIVVYGNPRGDNAQTVTEGMITQITSIPYILGSTEGIGFTTDAAISEGSSGAPAYDKNNHKLVGVVFETTHTNTSFLIPADVLRQNIRRYIGLRGNTNQTGFVTLPHFTPNITFQPVYDAMRECRAINEALVQHGALSEKMKNCNKLGVRVTSVPERSGLCVGDIIFRVNGYDLHLDGKLVIDAHTISLASMDILLDETNDGYIFEVLRLKPNGGRTQYDKLKVEVKCTESNELVPRELCCGQNEFFPCGDLILGALNMKEILEEIEDGTITAPEVVATKYAKRKQPQDQAVYVKAVKQATENPDESVLHLIVKKINGHAVFNLLGAYHHMSKPIVRNGTHFIEVKLSDDQIHTVNMGTDFERMLQTQETANGISISALDALSQKCGCALRRVAFDHARGLVICASCKASLSRFSFSDDGRVRLVSPAAAAKAQSSGRKSVRPAEASAERQSIGLAAEADGPRASEGAESIFNHAVEAALFSVAPSAFNLYSSAETRRPSDFVNNNEPFIEKQSLWY